MLFGRKKHCGVDIAERRRLAHDALAVAIDAAIKEAVESRVDPRLIAECLERRAQGCRVQWASTAPIM